MERITTFEYSEIPYKDIIGDISKESVSKQLSKLESLIKDKYEHLIELKLDRVYFRNFVGIIKIGDVIIEVLPKIFNIHNNQLDNTSRGKIYKNLYYMINRSSKSSLKNIDISKYGSDEGILFLDLFINMYLQQLYINLFKGIYRTYVTQSDNLHYIRGRIVIAENIKRNLLNTKIYCEYDEFTEDNLVNQIFKFTTKKMLEVSKWQQNRTIAQNIIHTLADVSNIYVTKDTFALIREDRLLGEYSKLLRLAKMFLEGHSFDTSDSHYKDNFIFNIDMNIVFQEYIFELIKEFSTDIFEQVSVFSQYGKSHLIYDENDKGAFLLKPDIALVSNKRVIILIDTKYKILRKEQRRSGVSDRDVYQMFGYYHKYGKPKIYLLYPKYTDDISIAYKFEKQEIEKLFINTIDLSKELYLPEGELAVLNQLKEIFSPDF